MVLVSPPLESDHFKALWKSNLSSMGVWYTRLGSSTKAVICVTVKDTMSAFRQGFNLSK